MHTIGTEITRRRFVELAAVELLLQRFCYPKEVSIGQKLLPTVTTHLLSAGSPIQEPYASLHGGKFDGPTVLESPDPLVRYRWNNPDASDGLQIYVLSPVASFTVPPASFLITKSTSGQQDSITVESVGSIRLDFGVESHGWSSTVRISSAQWR